MKKALKCLLFAVFIFYALPGQPPSAQNSSREFSRQHIPYRGIYSSDIALFQEVAREGLEAKQYRPVARLCERILQKDIVNKEAYFLLGIAHHYLGEHDLAVEELQWLVFLDKDNAIAREYLEKSRRKSISQWDPLETRLVKTAMKYHAEGLNGLAIGTLKEVIKQNSKNTEAWESLGDIYRNLGNFTIAKAAYNSASAQEKAREIKEEVKYIPKEWWEDLSSREAKLHEANLQFEELGEQVIQLEGRLGELDALVSASLILETKTSDALEEEKEKFLRQSKELDFVYGKYFEAKFGSPYDRYLEALGKTAQSENRMVLTPLGWIPLATLVEQEQGKRKVVRDYDAVEAARLIYENAGKNKLKEAEQHGSDLAKELENLRNLAGQYGVELSNMTRELEDLTKKFSEVKSHMDSLEEGLKYDFSQ